MMNYKRNHKFIGLSFAMALMSSLNCQAQLLPTPTQEAKPGVRWWWMGSAVDQENLKWNLGEYAKAGIGAVEITPLYGVQGNDKNDIPYLSPKWMDMLKFVEKENKQVGIETDMATGTGWPFGGPWVPISEAACKAVFVDTIVDVKQKLMEIEFNVPQKERAFAKLKVIKAFPVEGAKNKKRVIALYESRTRQKVKRAAPGGEGYVIDHFDSTAVANYLQHIDSAFVASKTPYPHTFFNDSYEVYGANWTPNLLPEFEKYHGYKLQDKFPEFLDGDAVVVSDYRETLGDMLLHNFTEQWTKWANKRGAITRNQAHGSPANLIDCYAAVDIPEIEGFGLTDFGIKGLRKDPGKTRPNFSDLTLMCSRVFFELSDIDRLLLFADPAGFEGISGKLDNLFFGEVELARQLIIVLADVSAEVCRIIRIDADLRTFCKKLFDFRTLHFRANEGIRQRAGGKTDLMLHRIVDKVRIFDNVRAMIDTFHADDFQEVTDMLDGVLLVDIRMGRETQAGLFCFDEDGEEFHRRIVVLIRVEADTDEHILVRQGFFQRLSGRLSGEVAQETHDEASINVHRTRIDRRTVETFDESFKCDAAAGVCLRVEENFYMTDILFLRMLQIGHRQIVEIVFRLEHIHRRIVHREERRQIVILVGLSDFFDGGLSDIHMILLGERELQLRFQTSFDVQVQLCLRHTLYKFHSYFVCHDDSSSAKTAFDRYHQKTCLRMDESCAITNTGVSAR